MTKEQLKESLLDVLTTLSDKCGVDGWDNGKGIAIDEDSFKHASRFINKLERYDLLRENLKIIPLTDGNLGFEWAFETPKKAKFNIDFDRISDRLLWCCYIDGMKEEVSGDSHHLEELVPYIKRFLGVK